ncbi:MAG: ferritin [Atribacterota bacterium]|nr:ferritin [Candidatus Atribacteria bacterium]
MMSKKMEEAINEQINKEFYSAYLYLAMAAKAESINLKGTAQWLKVQYREELGHGMKFYEFMNDRGSKVVVKAIEQPPVEFASVLDIFQQTLEHERKVTALINALYDLAVKDRDYAAMVELQWFINEQVEEEKNATEIVETLKMVGDKGAGLVMLDRELGKRE